MAEDLQEHCVGNISHVATLYRAATGTGKRNNGLLIARRITITLIRDFLNDTINNCCRVGTILSSTYAETNAARFHCFRIYE
jgi:hypothetical protein